MQRVRTQTITIIITRIIIIITRIIIIITRITIIIITIPKRQVLRRCSRCCSMRS